MAIDKKLIYFKKKANYTTEVSNGLPTSSICFIEDTGEIITHGKEFKGTDTWRPVGTGATDAAAGNHTHTISLAADTGTSSITLAHGSKYKLTAGGNSVIFTMPSTPTHTLSLATDSGDSTVSLAANTKYKLTAGGSTLIFTTPTDSNTWNAVSSTVDGYVPKIGTSCDTTIGTQADEWILTSTKGASPTWRKLPTTAFSDNNTWTALSSSAAGYAPVAANGTDSSSSNTYYFLGYTGTTVNWYKLPENAFKNDNTWTALSGASSSADGTAGYAPQPKAGDLTKYLKGDGTWATIPTYTNNVTSHLRLGASLATSNATSDTSNPYLTLVEGSTYDSQIQFSAGTGITISGNNGVITITNSSPDQNHNTDTKVTTAAASASTNYYIVGKANAADTNTGYTSTNVYFKDGVLYSNGTAVSVDGHTHSYLPLSGGTMTGALNFKNSTWNLVGDDCYMGDCDIAGAFGIKGANGLTNIAFYNYSTNTSAYTKLLSQNVSSSITITLPSTTGTLALVGDNNHTHDYLPLSGGTLTGDLTISKTTTSGTSGGKLILRGVYDSNNWDGQIISDYLGNQVCTTDGYTHGMFFKGGRNGCDNFIFVDSNSSALAKIDASGNIYAAQGSFYQQSDIRYKNVINNINLKVEDIANLPIFDFTWKDKDNSEIFSGTSAQSVQEILPNLISDDGRLTLDYAVLGTIEGIAVAKELVKLKERVKELEAKLNEYGRYNS